MKTIKILILLFICFPAYAGMDFTGGDKAMIEKPYIEIPDFKSRQEAFVWANKVEDKEQTRRKLKVKLDWFKDLAYLDSEPNIYQIQMAQYYMAQWDRHNWALQILENFKHPKDQAMVHLPDFASKEDARMWADQARHDISAPRRLKKKMVKVWFEAYAAKHSTQPYREALIMAQYERCYEALKILQSNVGAGFVAYSIPVVK